MVFPVGSPSQVCANVTIVDDDDLEGDHNFAVFISDPGSFAMTGTPQTTVITISDNESK